MGPNMIVADILSRYGQDLTKVWPIYVQYMANIWPIYGQNMANIWSRYGQDKVFDIKDILLRYGQCLAM